MTNLRRWLKRLEERASPPGEQGAADEDPVADWRRWTGADPPPRVVALLRKAASGPRNLQGGYAGLGPGELGHILAGLPPTEAEREAEAARKAAATVARPYEDPEAASESPDEPPTPAERERLVDEPTNDVEGDPGGQEDEKRDDDAAAPLRRRPPWL